MIGEHSLGAPFTAERAAFALAFCFCRMHNTKMAALKFPPQDPTPSAPPDVEPAAVEDASALVADASVGRLTEARRERVRQRVVSEIPWWYSPWGHLAATTGVGIATLVVSSTMLHGVRWTDIVVIPLVCLFANFFEWNVHKHVLHHRRWPFAEIYDKHTPMHHMMYVEEDMALRSTKEFRLVLIPALGVVGIVLTTAPFAWTVGRFWSANAGWLFLVTASLFMVSYELLHLAYHAPLDSFVGRRRFLTVLRAHHARHHDPRLMQKWNFNVTIPLFDWVLGTIAPDVLPPKTTKSPRSRS
jgi:hypothetical protein